MKYEIYNIKGLNPDNGYVIPCFGSDAEIDIRKANVNEENRIKVCTSLAAISTGKNESSNPESRFKALLKEAAYNRASRPLEFIPVVLDGFINHCDCEDEVYGFNIKLKNGYENMFIQDFLNKIGRFSKVKCVGHDKKNEQYKIYTNMRTLINARINYDNIPYNNEEDVKDFYAFKLRVPMFVFNHCITHTQLSKVTRSDRVTNNKTNTLWFPDDLIDRCKNYKTDLTYKNNIKSSEDLLLDILHKDGDLEQITRLVQEAYPQETFRNLLKDLGYKKEIFQRAVMEMRYKDFVMAGWNDEYGWNNFLAERGALDWKTWVQEETSRLAIIIKDCIERNG